MLKELPMSANAATPTTFPLLGIRYSKFPSSWVSPPIEVNDRGSDTTLFPVTPVNTPISATPGGTPGTGTVGPMPVDEIITFCDVMNVSSGAIGLIHQTL